MLSLDDSIREIRGVGDQRAKLLEKLGVKTVNDLLYMFPRRLEDRSQLTKVHELREGEPTLLCCRLMSVKELTHTKHMTKATFSDGSGYISAVWFNNKYIIDQLILGKKYHLYGKPMFRFNRWELVAPVLEDYETGRNTARIVPVYPLTAKLSQKILTYIMECALKSALSLLPETLPTSLRVKYNLPHITYCIQNIHFPTDYDSFEQSRRRLAFEELLTLKLGLSMLRSRSVEQQGMTMNKVDMADFTKILKFTLTEAQQRAIGEVISDLTSGIAMNRLIQGDVGCGKTAVAAAALYVTVLNGYQGVMLAPTALLASQHYDSISQLFEPLGINVTLLLGGAKTKSKRAIMEDISNGVAKIIIATHAVLEADVTFDRLALVIADEQHRFGVKQRLTLTQKGHGIHYLIMTATPIPRTLALMLYGDLAISRIEQMPQGRLPIQTYCVNESYRQRLYNFVLEQVKQGRQAYVVCPLVEESETSDLKSVSQLFEQLKSDIFKNVPIALLHGKMKQKEKDEIMTAFASNEIKVLVSTVVIEVGINVPNATVMVVENAERFGLAQLHQLRGRVGRGQFKSYCILINNSNSEISSQRMKTMTSTTDGFEIADKDLELRGPGEFFGVNQHGLPELKVTNLTTDTDILAQSHEAAQEILKEDPKLNSAQYQLLRNKLVQMNLIY